MKHDGSGEASTEQIVGRFKAVIEVEGKEERKAYLERKEELIETLKESLKQLARNREIGDFNLDLEMLESMEGRYEMKQ